MKTFKNMAAQGDVMFIRVASLPAGAVPVPAVGGQHVIAHSETGHHHVMVAERAGRPVVEMYRLPEEIYEAFLVVHEPTVLEHQRGFDTHEPIQFQPGTYQVRRQREYTPEGYRRAQD